MGNFVIDRTTGVKEWEVMPFYVRIGMHLLYCGTSLQASVMRSRYVANVLHFESVEIGRTYDNPRSKANITSFIKTFDLQDSLEELQDPDPTHYRTFNEFFARTLKAGSRPISEPSNPTVISSVADCRLMGFQDVDLATQIWIKGYGFSLGKLFGPVLGACLYEHGSLAIHRLAPQDYHRWHSPIDGVIKVIKEIPGSYHTVNPQAIKHPGTIDVFCENRRSIMIIERKQTGKCMAVVAVGAMLVGSIVYSPGIEVGAEIHRGQELGKFQYGGSTVIVLAQQGEMWLDEDLVVNSSRERIETKIKVGERIGQTPTGIASGPAAVGKREAASGTMSTRTRVDSLAPEPVAPVPDNSVSMALAPAQSSADTPSGVLSLLGRPSEKETQLERRRDSALPLAQTDGVFDVPRSGR